LLGYWRLVKKKRKKHKGLMKEDRRVFETFFESICPHAWVSMILWLIDFVRWLSLLSFDRLSTIRSWFSTSF
jgi:hypothetical protein